MKILIVLGVFLCVAATGLSEKVDVKDCGSKLGTLGEVDIFPCPSLPCPFKRTTMVNMSVHFTANEEIANATSKVYGYIAGVKVPFPLPDENACHFMKCPLPKGNSTVWNDGVYVDPHYPKIQLVVMITLQTDGAMDVCFTFPAEITD